MRKCGSLFVDNMNTPSTKMIGCAALVGVAITTLLLIVALVSSFNSYSRLEVQAKALQTDNTNVLDNTRKAIRDAAAISDKEVEALVDIIVGNSQARGSTTAGNGAAVTVGVVHEAVPAVTEVKTLNKLMNIVVAGRKDWQNAQTRLIEVKRQGDAAIATFPGNLVLGVFGKKPIEIVIVTSSETKGNFQTGEDNSQWIEKKSTPAEK